MKIGGRPAKLVSMAVIAALAGVGVLSLAYNYRDFAFWLAADLTAYKSRIRSLQSDLGLANEINDKQRRDIDSLGKRNDALNREVGALERKIEEHKLSFKREIVIRLHGFEKEISVRRDWERGSSLLKKDKDLAYLVIHDFSDIGRDTALTASDPGFKHPGSPWYIDRLLSALDKESRVIDGVNDDCVRVPRQMTTWSNHYRMLITKVEIAVRCETRKAAETVSPEYWLGTASDSSRWIMSLRPATLNPPRVGYGVKDLERVLDSLDLQSYYRD